jgi:hypothetical protein
MSIPSVIIIGADKGGVGKTTVTRTLTEYLTNHQVRYRLFDTESPTGDLKRFSPDAEIIDISKVQSQMKVFDVRDGDPLTVVDMRAGLFSHILQQLDDAQLLQDVRAGALNLILIHVLGPTVNSIGEIASIAEKLGGGAKHFLVKNHINDTTFFDYVDALKNMSDVTVVVPQLVEVATETVQKLGTSFRSFSADPQQSRILRGRVTTWLGQVWKEFDRVRMLEQVK